MKKKLVVVVDMVNGFVNIGALHDINHIVPGIRKMIEENLELKNDVIDFRDCHSLTDEEFKAYPVHCLDGTIESELVPELKPLAHYMIDIPKNTTNGFNTEKFRKFYEEHYDEYDEVIVVGCCTDICVTDFTTSLIDFQKENGINTRVTVPMNLVETFDGPGHNRKTMNEIGFEKMRKAGANIVREYGEEFGFWNLQESENNPENKCEKVKQKQYVLRKEG